MLLGALGDEWVTLTWPRRARASLTPATQADITVAETFTGFDPACPFKYTTSCQAPGTIKPSTMVGLPTIGDVNKCEIIQTVQVRWERARVRVAQLPAGLILWRRAHTSLRVQIAHSPRTARPACCARALQASVCGGAPIKETYKVNLCKA